MAQFRDTQKTYDFAIVGAELPGLLTAAALSHAGHSVALISSSERVGSFLTAQNTETVRDHHLQFFPDTPSAQSAIHFLKERFQLPLDVTSSEHTPLTFESGEVRPFLGFGDHPTPSYYDELSFYLESQQLTVTPSVSEWVEPLYKIFRDHQGIFFDQTEVTRFEVQDENVETLIVNGTQKITAQNYIYTESLKRLLEMNSLKISARQLKKVSRSRTWTTLALDCSHSCEVSKSQGVHILTGHDKKTGTFACLGRFSPSQGDDNTHPQMSQWLTFIDEEEAQNTELTAAAVGKMKRQIRRAFPEISENTTTEKLSVLNEARGVVDFTLSGNQTLPHLKNLWIASSQVSQNKGILGEILQAHLVLSSILTDWSEPLPPENSAAVEQSL